MGISVQDRNKSIIKVAAVGILVNFLLFAGKIITGMAIDSNVIVLDAVNSLSDSISCVFIIISSFLAMRNADRTHPFGFGRLEYVCSMLFAMFIMHFGANSVIKAVKAIIAQDANPNYNLVSIILMSVSMLSKILFGFFARKKGKELKSPSLQLAGTDSISDSLVALSILVGIAAEKLFGLGVENYLCILIALMLIKNGFSMLRDCLNKILGMRVDPEFTKKIRTMIIREDGVLNVSNLLIHDYGEGNYIGSVDIAVDEKLTALEIGRISNRIKDKADEMGLKLTSVGVSAMTIDSPEAVQIQDCVIEIVAGRDGIARISSLTVDMDRNVISLAVAPEFNEEDHEKERVWLENELSKRFPEMNIDVALSINTD